MKPRICILINNYEEIEALNIIEQYLPSHKYAVTIACDFPSDYVSYNIIAPLNYKKIIKEVDKAHNIIIFHAADLPNGKGWAPIYYVITEKKEQYVVTGIKASKDVDSGDIVIKARFEILANYTATFLRLVDYHLFFLLIAKLLEVWPTGNLSSIKQEGSGNYRKRRYPSDNEIDVSLPFINLIPHLRAVEQQHPAYFKHEVEKYFVSVYPENKPIFPKKVFIEYSAIDRNEIWEGWA